MEMPPKLTESGMAQGGTTAWPGMTTALENMVVPWGGGGGVAGVGGAGKRVRSWSLGRSKAGGWRCIKLHQRAAGAFKAAPPFQPSPVRTRGSARCSCSAAMGFLPVTWAPITKPTKAGGKEGFRGWQGARGEGRGMRWSIGRGVGSARARSRWMRGSKGPGPPKGHAPSIARRPFLISFTLSSSRLPGWGWGGWGGVVGSVS
jgi:hypothetical protein